MFESVTKKRKNPFINFFGWSLLTVVCVVFIFIGFSPNSNFLGQGGAAAEVNGDAISLREYKEMLDRFDNANPNSGRDQRRKTQEDTINFLVNRSLIVQEAEKLNIHVSDQEVGKELIDIDFFYEDGVFSRLRYKTYLRQARLTEGEFEDKIRQDLIIRKMSSLIGFASKDLDMMDKFDEKVDQAQINVGYVRLSPGLLRKPVTDAEAAELLSSDEAKVKAYFTNNKQDYDIKEQVKARHILIKAKDQEKKSMDAALEKAKKIRAEVTAENFSAIAKKHSEDPGSKAKGGDLGFFTRGRMVPTFEKAAFSAAVGDITDPVESKFGYHIIIVDEKSAAEDANFDNVKNQIARKLVKEEKYENFLKQIKDKLKSKNYSELETLLSDNKLNWTSTGFFSIANESIPGIGQNEQFFEVAMGLGPDKDYPDNLVYQGDFVYLMKFKGAKIDASGKKNNQMDFFKQLMKQQRSNAIVQSWTNSLRAGAKIKINPDVLR